MNLLSWNCRGLGRDSVVGELRWLVKQYRPSLLFLSETKMREERVKPFMWSLGYNGCLAVNCQGRSGGLVLFWSTEHCVSLQSLCPNFIDVHVTETSGMTWRATFVYGEPKTAQRHVFWDRLRFLKAQWQGPWVCIGDFNEALSNDEHLGPTVRDENQMRLFRECLEDCQLVDLGFCGPKFTWNNRQQGASNIRVRLDRAVANGQFTQLYDDVQVENIITTSSDHFVVHLAISKHGERRQRETTAHRFRYEAAWCRAPDYLERVEKSWADGSAGPRNLKTTWTKLSEMAKSLSEWSKNSFGSPRKEINKLEKRLLRLRIDGATRSYSQEESDIEHRLCELFEREEIMARQRSRVDWLQAGDRNTSFFQARATSRRRTNKIKYLMRHDGTKCEDQSEIREMARLFHMELFTTEPQVEIDKVLEAIPLRIDQAINEDLCKPYSNEEIKEALFQMGPTKAPGPDGFPALFYQKHWTMLQDDICEAVRNFLHGDDIPVGLCDTTIVLIPKMSKPEHLTNYRPISLCNVLYKIASKVLANRLKGLLPSIIAEEQSAFVPRRLITDNVLIAYECMHTIRRQRAKTPFFALKIDMMKAYDRVEWTYLHGVLQRLGFAQGWINSVMRCVSSVRYSVRVNEGLSCLLKNEEQAGRLKGTYCRGSGQKINLHKSSLYFGQHCPADIKQKVMDSLDVHNEALQTTYLGMPTYIGRSRKSAFNFIAENIWKRV